MNHAKSPGAVLDEALVLTEAMYLAARDAQWERLDSLEDQRQPLLMRQFPRDMALLRVMGRILELDASVRAALTEAREQAAQAWQATRSAHKALTSYIET